MDWIEKQVQQPMTLFNPKQFLLTQFFWKYRVLDLTTPPLGKKKRLIVKKHTPLD